MVYLIGSSEIDLYLRCPQIRRWTVRNAKVTPLGATWERTQALRGLRLGDLVELEVHHQQLCEQVLRLTRSFFACRTVGERLSEVIITYYLQLNLNSTKPKSLCCWWGQRAGTRQMLPAVCTQLRGNTGVPIRSKMSSLAMPWIVSERRLVSSSVASTACAQSRFAASALIRGSCSASFPAQNRTRRKLRINREKGHNSCWR
jgi:hypothetical protein